MALGPFCAAHRLYLRHYNYSIIYTGLVIIFLLSDRSLWSLLLPAVWHFIDVFSLYGMVSDYNRDPRLSRKYLVDGYKLAFPLGIFGLHHVYLCSWERAVSYLFSFGGLGLGWLYDLVAMPRVVSHAQWRIRHDPLRSMPPCTVISVYVSACCAGCSSIRPTTDL